MSLACWASITAQNRLAVHRAPYQAAHGSLAEFAVIAIENARLYAETINERAQQLETVLTDIEDGVIVIDQDQRLILVNQVVREALQLDNEGSLIGRPFREIFTQAG